MSSDYTASILDALSLTDGPVLTAETFPDVAYTTIKSNLDRLGSREMITYAAIPREEYQLSEEADGIAKEGSHEARVFYAVQAMNGLQISELQVGITRRTTTNLVSNGLMSRVKSGKRAQRLAKARH